MNASFLKIFKGYDGWVIRYPSGYSKIVKPLRFKNISGGGGMRGRRGWLTTRARVVKTPSGWVIQGT